MTNILRIVEQWHASDVGRQRQGNEDSVYVRAPLFAVADGMGGAQAGEVASEIAVSVFEHGLAGGDASTALVELIHKANRRINELSQTEKGRAGMGTTVTAAFVDSEDVVVAHVGDSRAYCLRGTEMIRLTTDHSLVSELVARGKLTEQQAEVHPQRSVITRALGPEPDVQVDVEKFQASDGDIFLLCSDGLTGMVKEQEIASIIANSPSLADGGRGLIAAANEAGGRDNITVILFRLDIVERVLSGGSLRASEGVEQEQRYADGSRTTAIVESNVEATAVLTGPMASDVVVRRKSEIERSGGGTRLGGDEGEQQVSGDRVKPKRKGRRYLVWTVSLVLISAILLMGGWFASRQVYFVGTDSQNAGTVTIFRGLPYEFPGGIKLYERYEPSGVTLAQVPLNRRSTFTNHKLRSRKDAEGLVTALERGELS